MLGLATGITNTSYQWQPNMVGADLKLWLRNGVGVAVGQWDDSSGNANHAVQGTSGNQAVLAEGGLNFELDDESHYDLTDDIVIAAQEAFIVFLVCERESTSERMGILGVGSNNDFLEFTSDRKVRFNSVGSDDDQMQYDAGAFAADEKMIVTIQRESGSTGLIKTFKNGSLLTVGTLATGDGNNTGAITFNTIANRNNNRHFDGIIHEMLVYDTTDLTTAEINKVNNYLLNKHNL